MPSLTPRERARLKARAHPLEPVVHIGQAGVTEAVLREVERALAAHQLIKVRVDVADRDERDATCAALAERTASALVQRVGKVLILWRPAEAPPAGD